MDKLRTDEEIGRVGRTSQRPIIALQVDGHQRHAVCQPWHHPSDHLAEDLVSVNCLLDPESNLRCAHNQLTIVEQLTTV